MNIYKILLWFFIYLLWFWVVGPLLGDFSPSDFVKDPDNYLFMVLVNHISIFIILGVTAVLRWLYLKGEQ